jgi:NAD(P)-dependent dehydrogenase (short-subunit alcohol dehydrogenase family)
MTSPLPYAVNPLPFANKVITVTGASRGLGLALTKYLLVRGATVSMCATSAENLAKATQEIDTEIPDAKDRYWTCVVDIGDLDNVRSWIEETGTRFGKLDGCANVAGRSYYPIYLTLITNMPVERWSSARFFRSPISTRTTSPGLFT